MMAWFRCFFGIITTRCDIRSAASSAPTAARPARTSTRWGSSAAATSCPVRRVFSRDRGEFTRTMSWEPSTKGW